MRRVKPVVFIVALIGACAWVAAGKATAADRRKAALPKWGS